jgi:molecular chaperone GrpE
MSDKKKKKIEEVEPEVIPEKDPLAEPEKEEDKVITCEDLLSSLEAKHVELKNTMLKDRADLENTKKRLEKERITERKYAAINVCRNLLTPLDNFDLALKHTVTTAETEAVFQGFKMIKDQLIKALEDEGVSEIDALNEEYDPNFHQAIMTEKVEDKEPNLVLEVLQKGYLFKDRVIRPAIVKISE